MWLHEVGCWLHERQAEGEYLTRVGFDVLLWSEIYANVIKVGNIPLLRAGSKPNWVNVTVI